MSETQQRKGKDMQKIFRELLTELITTGYTLVSKGKWTLEIRDGVVCLFKDGFPVYWEKLNQDYLEYWKERRESYVFY